MIIIFILHFIHKTTSTYDRSRWSFWNILWKRINKIQVAILYISIHTSKAENEEKDNTNKNNKVKKAGLICMLHSKKIQRVALN
jgi:hypothetical protein